MEGEGVGIWVKWLFASVAVWFLSVAGFAFIAMAAPHSPLVYVFGALFSISILAALAFLFLVFRGLFDEG